MQSFPMFLKTTGRKVIIAGAGEQATQKARLLLKTDAKIIVLAQNPATELAAMIAAGQADLDQNPITKHSFADAMLVFIATGDLAEDTRLHALAKQAKVLVNVVDQPNLCDATTPAIVDRDPVVIAIGTEGTAPVLARRIKTDIETRLDPQLGGFATLCGQFRQRVATQMAADQRRPFWHRVFTGPIWQAYRRGEPDSATQMLEQTLQHSKAKNRRGQICLIGAGPGARDLLTLRAVERLQEADIIIHDRQIDHEVLELARRDAERVAVGAPIGTTIWSQDPVYSLVLAAAKRGQSVVRLKSGDLSHPDSTHAEIIRANAAGLAIEIIPGVTETDVEHMRVDRQNPLHPSYAMN